ncbi:hypothetical protein MKW98_005968 [Papaver atlanticum]|uniref:3'-5' exonuclease domain-containing protein n=1 Tax=Papaver atlanticum TaxID=357466 RepID=A0AAD4S751_9MAGN|nr:hypothetical protein MKW98_005968 [Papaver atlanticum]
MAGAVNTRKNGNSTITTTSSKNGNAMSNSTSNADGNNGGPSYWQNADIFELDVETVKQQTYNVKFYPDRHTPETIYTTVTRNGDSVDKWIKDVEESFARQLENNNLIVGLDIEWVRLSDNGEPNKVAVLQLCLAHRCLIFQFFGLFGKSKKIQKVPVIPESLYKFLNDERIIFVGSGIDQDARKLMVDWGLNVVRSEELAGLAEYLGREDLYKAGLKSLMREVLGQDLRKPRALTLSRWDLGRRNDVSYLTDDQIIYACLDAYSSFKLGMDLIHRTVANKRINRYPQKDYNNSPQEANHGQAPKTASQGQGARGSYKEATAASLRK